MKSLITENLLLVSLLSLFLSLGACASTPKEEDASLKEVQGQEQQGQEKEQEAEQSAEEKAAENQEATSDEKMVEKSTSPSEVEEPVVQEKAPVATKEKRVVRYIPKKHVYVYSAPSEDKKTKKYLRQGLRVLVIDQGEFSKVSDTIYVKTTELSVKPVGRSIKKSKWIKPKAKK